MKIISCGIFIFNPKNELLIGHTTNGKWNNWSIPKGELESGESYQSCAIRETKEETGLVIHNPIYVDTVSYSKQNKDLVGFYHKLEYDIPLSSIKCRSMFKDKDGKELPEIDKFRWIDPKLALPLIHLTQQLILTKILKNYIRI